MLKEEAPTIQPKSNQKREMLDYYSRLEVAELEGDLLKASLGNDPQKMAAKFKQLITARGHLSQSELAQHAGTWS